MISIIAIFFPAFVLIYIKELIFKQTSDLKQNIISYLLSVLMINLLMLTVLVVVFKSNENLVEKLNSYNNFALKYIILALFFAIVIPFLEQGIKTKNISVILFKQKFTFKYWRCLALTYTIILFTLNFIRIFDNNFWGDEGFTIRLAKMSISDMLIATAEDVHPPLYYFITQIFCKILGFNGAVYHFISLIPYALILVVCLTIIWDLFGKEAALIVITLASLLTNAIQYNVEVRMYSWGALFVFLSFIFLYKILCFNRMIDYFSFIVSSLAAAYTHYYCLISVAFFYLTLFLIALIKERRLLFRIVITCILTIIGYLPWFFVLLHTFQRTSDNYWMTSIPSFEECLCFLFYGKYQLILNIIFLSVTIFYLLRESGVAIINRVYNQLYPFKILIDFSAINITPEIIWVLSGYLSIFGTIGVGLGLSHIIRPMFIVRYIFPVATIAWVVMGICISKLPFKQYISLSLICIILIGGLQEYYWIYKADKNANELLTNTLNVISGQIQNEDQILTDVYHIDWTLVDVYYPGIKHQMLSASIYESLDENLMYWVILTEKMNNDIATSFAEENFMCECVVEEGNFGTLTVWVYKVYSGVNV